MSKKLVIRINNLQDIETSDDYEVAEETAIRWDRVITVAVVVSFLVVLVCGAWYIFSSEESASEEQLFDVVSQSTVPEPDVSKLVVSEPIAIESENPIIAVKKDASSVIQDEQVERNAPVAEAAIVVIEPIIVDETTAAETTVDTSADLVDETSVPSIDEAPVAAAVFIDPIVIESNRIARAQLTHGVNKSEPVDRLGNVVSMNADKLIRVYLFTGMEGLKGETLYHDWYLSGKKMARVKIKVRSNQTSASSSKFIDQYMMGDWKVQVTTSRGDELVSARFNVTP